jgi:hypothetical protein
VRTAPSTGSCSAGQPPVGITGEDGNAAGTYVFNNLCFTNTGSQFVKVIADVEGRKDTPVNVLSNKVNVKP